MTVKKKIAPKATKSQIGKQARLAWRIGAVVLMLTLGLEFFMHPHAEFIIDGTLFFHAWYGFAACLVIIVTAKALSFLKRKENYYRDGDDLC